MRLSDTQRLILTAAALHPDGIAAPPAKLPPAPRAAVARALLQAGLLTPTTVGATFDPGLAWKLDGAPVVLSITEAGRRRVGVVEAGPETEAAVASTTEHSAPMTAEESASPDATTLVAAAQGAPVAPNDSGNAAEPSEPDHAEAASARRGTPLRQAAHAVLAAWDDAVGDRRGLPAVIEQLRALLTKPMRTRTAGTTPRKPRQGTKQEAVLALLRRPEGASGLQIADATGWAPHTVRGFLALLGKKGVAVTVLERVRQVGPNKQGAKGSFTIYRIAE